MKRNEAINRQRKYEQQQLQSHSHNFDTYMLTKSIQSANREKTKQFFFYRLMKTNWMCRFGWSFFVVRVAYLNIWIVSGLRMLCACLMFCFLLFINYFFFLLRVRYLDHTFSLWLAVCVCVFVSCCLSFNINKVHDVTSRAPNSLMITVVAVINNFTIE